MAFLIQPVKEFVVSPALPESVSRLSELAYNLLWTWDYQIRTLFRRLDAGLWRSCGHNAVLMLSRLPQSTLERAATDPRFLSLYKRACERYDYYMAHGLSLPPAPKDHMQVAYFSMEYGLLESLPIYSGGLGILSGDHLKASSDDALNLVGIGLLYQTGYLQQHLTPDGWQTEKFPTNDFYNWPVRPALTPDGQEVKVSVDLPGGTVWIKVWRMMVGRVPLLLLDTNIPENPNPVHRDITDALYGGDTHTRMRQEIVLGMGGLRALKATGFSPNVFHMNEGHSAFLALERVRLLMEEHHLTFDEALEAARSNSVFTTHTPVPAGIDMFDPGLIHEYFADYCRRYHIPFEKFLHLGQGGSREQGDRFSMAVLAMKASSYRNGVSRLHAEVSQHMFQDLWPDLPLHEIPIAPITNGVHLPTWLNGDTAQLFDQFLSPDWRERYPDRGIWDQIVEIPDRELWESHRRRKRQLVSFVRERQLQRATQRRAPATEIRRINDLFDPDVFTLGFARRFATYKRATLLFRDMERLKNIVSNARMPMQIIVAGKAHPQDNPGKQFIREIFQFTKDPVLSKHVVFIEDYDMQVGREMVQGVDLWLNNPRRGEEASGTSGMKAAINGNLNLSILDGWFDEAYEVSGGWAIGDREEYSPDLDEIHASIIYNLLENEILPMYYNDREEGVPTAWMQRVKQTLMNLSPVFNCQRMIRQYSTRLYEPSYHSIQRMKQDDFQPAREKVSWMQKVERAWPNVRIKDASEGAGPVLLSGRPLQLKAQVDLSGLNPEDVRVEAVVGHIDSDGLIEDTTVLTLPPEGEQNGVFLFGREFVPHQTGRLGYTLRISPNHFDDPLARPVHAHIKWAGPA